MSNLPLPLRQRENIANASRIAAATDALSPALTPFTPIVPPKRPSALHHARPLTPLDTTALIEETTEQNQDLRHEVKLLTNQNRALREAGTLTIEQFNTLLYVDALKQYREKVGQVEWENERLSDELAKASKDLRNQSISIGRELEDMRELLAQKEETIKEKEREIERLVKAAEELRAKD